MEQRPQLIAELAGFYQQKRDLFAHLLQGSALKLLPCKGTYFQLVDYSAISALNDLEFCQWLTVDHGVAAIPLSVFSRQEQDSKIIRFCFAKQQSTLEQAAERLCRLHPSQQS
jgi:methionine aminotransferase